MVDATGAGGRSLSCPSCSGVLCGLSPFERMLTPGLGARVWVASASAAGPAGGACPYCRRPMHTPEPAAADLPAGLQVCRLCEQVWVPDSAREWVAAHAAPGSAGSGAPGAGGGSAGSVGGAPAGRCPNCGAPLEPDPAGRCRFCRTQVAAPAPVVIAAYGPDGLDPGAGRRTRSGLLGLLDLME